MDNTYLATYYQQPADNLLMEFISAASKTENLLNLSIGDPDLKTPDSIIEAAFKDVMAGHTHYTASNGSADFINSILTFYKRHYQLDFKPEQVRATVGALQGMYLTMQVLLNKGDEVIIHEPFFSPYKNQVLEAGGTPVIIPTYEEDGFQINIDILKKAITPNTKALIINSPNNPTGAVFSEKTIKAIAELAIKNNFYILSDEVYEAFSFYENFVPMAKYAPNHTITFSSFSKAFAMTGWRIGYMIAPAYINEACALLNEDITYSAPTPSQRAGIYAINHYETITPTITDTFKERLDFVDEQVQNCPFLSLHPVKGSMYAFINISKTGLTSVDFAMKLLKEQQVLVIPGKAFGDSGDDYVRLAATQSLAVLSESFERINRLKF
ncbi:pyridoxal phosphate-dependent aminotransferase [Vagococcus vulneris]|uniref:Aminotransferase n=1 Tax=Vagococcus vulneris TaxID=1977869 RepID=A0A429ZYN1_9ENTE|nr:pyridoxal phosphate-dependent aminotransferase [Vagococcus vulneris]RST99094.1 aspartate aminotransferase [Vagococcus vulneris]